MNNEFTLILRIFRHFNIIKIVTHLEVTLQNVKQPKSGRNSGHVRNSDIYGMFIRDPNFSIPDPNFFHPGSRIFPSRINIIEFKYFNHNTLFLNSRKYDLGCSSWIRILIFLPIPDPGSRGQKGTVSRIRIRNTGNMCRYLNRM